MSFISLTVTVKHVVGGRNKQVLPQWKCHWCNIQFDNMGSVIFFECVYLTAVSEVSGRFVKKIFYSITSLYNPKKHFLLSLYLFGKCTDVEHAGWPCLECGLIASVRRTHSPHPHPPLPPHPPLQIFLLSLQADIPTVCVQVSQMLISYIDYSSAYLGAFFAAVLLVWVPIVLWCL